MAHVLTEQSRVPPDLSHFQTEGMRWQPCDRDLNFRGTWHWLPRDEEEDGQRGGGYDTFKNNVSKNRWMDGFIRRYDIDTCIRRSI